MAFPPNPPAADPSTAPTTPTTPIAPATPGGPTMLTPKYNEQRLLEIADILRRESTEYRWIWEREWLRDLYYVMNRQWIFYHPTRREWVDKRLQKWVPRPVTNKMAETLQAIRTNFAAVDLSVAVRPVGNGPQSMAAAEIADQMAPLIHEEHSMNQVMRENDFWLIATGNAMIQTSWDKDTRSNKVFLPNEQCQDCQAVLPPQAIVQAGQACPNCGSKNFQPAMRPDGQADGTFMPFGKGKTTALSPFEYAFAPNITRFDDLPYITRLRWRDKHWFEANKPELVNKIIWEKSPSDRSLQIFKSLALTNDVGTGSHFNYLGAGASHTVEGVTEYEHWIKPTPEFPQGFVMRVIGDKQPVLLDTQDEGVPGPLPYKDIEGNPLFPFAHAQYEHVGGRLLGRSAISPLIQKQDQLNQVDSLIQLIIQRMANPVWVVPEGAGIDNFTGEPGLVLKWNPLAVGGVGKPERLGGQEAPQSLWALREQILKDIEDLSGAFDIMKGQKPSGIEAFSALQLLVERSQSRFTSVFQSRGELYRRWYSLALELERQFGPQQRTQVIVEPNRGYTFHQFENAQLQSQVSIIIEDGSTVPKTTLGKRAAIEQANQLGLLPIGDPDGRYALLTTFGLNDLAPSLDIHVQAALQIQDTFEEWIKMPQGLSPLQVKPWHDAQIHYNERIKWLNTDRMRDLMQQNPAVEQIVTMHLQQLQMLMMPPPGMAPGGPSGAPGPPSGGKPPQGGALANKNSNQNSGATSSLPKGNAEMGPNVGPA